MLRKRTARIRMGQNINDVCVVWDRTLYLALICNCWICLRVLFFVCLIFFNKVQARKKEIYFQFPQLTISNISYFIHPKIVS